MRMQTRKRGFSLVEIMVALANRMGDGESLMFGEDGTSGVMGSVSGFYVKHVAKHLLLDSTVMRSVRIVGTVLLGSQMVYAVAALPWLLGGYLVATQWILAAGFAASCFYQSYLLGEHVAPMLEVQWNKISSTNTVKEQTKKNTGAGKNASIRYSAVPRDRQPARA